MRLSPSPVPGFEIDLNRLEQGPLHAVATFLATSAAFLEGTASATGFFDRQPKLIGNWPGGDQQ